MVGAAQLPVVAAAHFAVAELVAQGRRDLEVGAHFQDAVAGRAGRRDFERLEEARGMRVEVRGGCVANGPALQVFDAWWGRLQPVNPSAARTFSVLFQFRARWALFARGPLRPLDRKSTRLNSS